MAGANLDVQGEMTMLINRRQFGRLAMASLAAGGAPAAAFAAKPEIYTGFLSNSAVGGYDTVAYFTVGRPVKGSNRFKTRWKGADWYFSSRENLEKFKANPQAYAPQYGGYCAYGVSQNAAVKGDPLLWKIVNGKLYLNINRQVVNIWNKDIDGYIAKANRHWPGVLK